MHLLGLQFCKLNFVFKGEEAVAIRLYLLNSNIETCFKESELCSTQFMSFEFNLSACLLGTLFYIEQQKTNFFSKKKLYSNDFFNQKLLSANTLVSITDNVQWCFQNNCFKINEESAVLHCRMDPIVLAANATNHWREALLEQLDCRENLLIITNDVTLWPSSFTQITEFGHPLESKGTFIANSQNILKNFQKQMELLDAIKLISLNIYVARSDEQVRRFLVTNLAKKLPLFNLPVHFHKYGAVILDNFLSIDHIDLLPKSMTSRWIKVIHDNDNTRPTHLNFSQLKKCIDMNSKVLLSMLWAQTSAQITTFKVPKQVLRRFRITGHPIRDGIAEERIARIFPHGCPLKTEDAIQRFSGFAMPGALAAEFLTRHFQRLGSSIGEYSLPMTNSGVTLINKDFVNNSLNDLKKECSICYDPLNAEFNFTVCGHVFCGECSKTYFQAEFSQNKTKECAICRTNLILADIFKIKTFSSEAPFVSVLGSKAQSIQAFVKCMRNKNLASWAEVVQSNEEMVPKNIIVENVRDCTISLILQKKGPLNIHVFYSKEETAEFNSFQKNFTS